MRSCHLDITSKRTSLQLTMVRGFGVASNSTRYTLGQTTHDSRKLKVENKQVILKS